MRHLIDVEQDAFIKQTWESLKEKARPTEESCKFLRKKLKEQEDALHEMSKESWKMIEERLIELGLIKGTEHSLCIRDNPEKIYVKTKHKHPLLNFLANVEMEEDNSDD